MQERLRQRQPRCREPKYLKWVSQFPCAICGYVPTQVAHIRMGNIERGKRPTGLGEKPDDKFTVPLCVVHHAEQHSANERRWWESKGVDPWALVDRLRAAYEDSFIERWRK